jgi:signal transduction histidine kinase/DNA-binding response OmpR family regulator
MLGNRSAERVERPGYNGRTTGKHGTNMADTHTTNILIVDDLPEKHLVYRSILDELGQNMVSVRSGADALREVLKNDFAVILLDVNMPGMNGFETAHLIRQRKRSAHTPIIFLTAFADEVQTSQGYATGGVDYIPTPVVPEILRAKVRVFVELFRMRQQVADQAVEQTKRAAAEEMARRSAFLAEASRVLTSSLDFEATLRGLLRLIVPTLADLALVTQTEGPNHTCSSELAWLHPATGELLHAPTGPDVPRDSLRDCHERVLATGVGETLEQLNVPYPPGQPDHSSEQRIRSAIVLPLRARGRTLGAVTLALASAQRRFGPADRALAQDLAERAAIALDNARLYRDIQENDRRKNEFLAMLSHELRNPLAPVRNAVHILRQCGIDHPQVVWARDVINRQVSHLVRLVDDLLDVSRITRGKIRLQRVSLDVAGVVATALETSRPLIQRHGHELTVTLPEEPVRVVADPARLAQVLANLLNNAAKYTPDGGRISLIVEKADNEVVFRVRDTGAGIPAEMLTKVFDMFTQMDRSLDRSQGGLGVGLTLVRRLVELHGGTVEAFSDGLEKGSEFVVRLAAEGLEPKPAVERNGVGAHALAPTVYRVLVVDDNVDAADSLAVLLRLAGHTVRLAHDGPGAMEAAQGFHPDAVLLDLGLPGFDGYEVARRLRAQPEFKDVLLVAVSGYGQEEDRIRSRQSGFNHHLTKPVDFDLLAQVISSLPQELGCVPATSA